nr:MAG TPA: hypothetical protein [Caudoviricetes sp.]
MLQKNLYFHPPLCSLSKYTGLPVSLVAFQSHLRLLPVYSLG